MPKPTDFHCQFVKYLKGLAEKEDRAALAALRRGLGKPPGTAPEMFPIIVPWTSALKSMQEQEVFFIIASLFAWHPNDTSEGNLGTTFEHIGTPHGQNDNPSLERRFVALLNAHSDDLPRYLRHAVGLARSKEVPVNYAQLLVDIIPWSWNHPKRWVQHEWAKKYWGDIGAENQPAEQQA